MKGGEFMLLLTIGTVFTIITLPFWLPRVLDAAFSEPKDRS